MYDSWLVRAPLAVVPVFFFLAGVLQGGRYKLLRHKHVLAITAVGALAAGSSYVANVWAFAHFAGDFQSYSRYVSPWIEEALKAVVMVFLIRTGPVGLHVGPGTA